MSTLLGPIGARIIAGVRRYWPTVASRGLFLVEEDDRYQPWLMHPGGVTERVVFAEQIAQGIHSILAYGADPEATAAVNTAAINAAATAAGAMGLVHFPPGMEFDIDGTVTIVGPCMGTGCRLLYSGSGSGVVVSAGALVQNAEIHLPEVVHQGKTALGWDQASVVSSVGVTIKHMYNSTVHVPFVRNFAKGLRLYGEADGNDYNRVLIGHLSNNKINLELDATGDGWMNEDTFIGGRLGHDPAELQAPNTTATGQPGVRHVKISGSTTAVDILNSHRFYGMSLEGDVPEYHVECKGLHNYFDRCRWEAAVPKVLFSGANAIYNRIHGGYSANNIVVTQSGGAANNGVESNNGVRLQASPGDSVYVLSNGDSSATPILMGMPAGGDVYSPSDDWGFAMSSQSLRGKAPADTSARVTVNFLTGNITMNVAQFALLQSTAALTAASTLGSVTKRIMVLDQNGNIAGYLPIYDSIS